MLRAMQRARRDEGSHSPSHLHLPRLPSRPEFSRTSLGKNKNDTENSDNQKELPHLSIEIYELIAKRLNVATFCAFGAACQSFLEIYDENKEDFLEALAPLSVLMSAHAKRACYLYDMANGKTQMVMLPSLVGKFYLGCTAGYVIIEDRNCEISLIHPFTRHELKFPRPPLSTFGRIILHERIILATTLSSRSNLLIALSKSNDLQVYHSRTRQWYFCRFGGVDIAIFRGHVYVVSNFGRVGEFRVKSSDHITHGVFTWLQVKNTPNVESPYDLKLVVYDNQLLMVDFVPEKHLKIYNLDFDEVKWVKMDKLATDEALFWGGNMGCAIRKPGKWGGQSNCVYSVDPMSTFCSIYSMEAELIEKFSFVENPATSKLFSYFWYFPHQSMKKNYLLDD